MGAGNSWNQERHRIFNLVLGVTPNYYYKIFFLKIVTFKKKQILKFWTNQKWDDPTIFYCPLSLIARLQIHQIEENSNIDFLMTWFFKKTLFLQNKKLRVFYIKLYKCLKFESESCYDYVMAQLTELSPTKQPQHGRTKATNAAAAFLHLQVLLVLRRSMKIKCTQDNIQWNRIWKYL